MIPTYGAKTAGDTMETDRWGSCMVGQLKRMRQTVWMSRSHGRSFVMFCPMKGMLRVIS